MKTELHPIEIPLSSISEDALIEIISSFIEREGTDYGLVEVTFDKKVADIRRQLNTGEIKLYFDPASETVTFARA